MRRRIAALLGLVLAASALALVAPAPASATDVCAGQGTASTGPLFYPVTVQTSATPALLAVTVRQPSTVGFGFTFTPGLGLCVSSDGTLGKTVTAGGTLTGWCGHSSGQGVANDGANFAWVSAGSFLIITGHLVGIVNAIPDALAGESCLTGATSFIVTGAVVLLHCLVLASGLINTIVPPATLTTTSTTVGPVDIFPTPFPTLVTLGPATLEAGVHTAPMNYHWSVCVPGLL